MAVGPIIAMTNCIYVVPYDFLPLQAAQFICSHCIHEHMVSGEADQYLEDLNCLSIEY